MQLPLLLSLALFATPAFTDDWPGPGDGCDFCDYYNGIGYAPDPVFCGVFYVCQRSSYDDDVTTYYPLCCPDGLVWDAEKLTCRFPYFGMNLGCNLFRHPKCPTHEINNGPCPFVFIGGEPTKFKDATTDYIWMCPYGTNWDQSICTCAINATALYSIDRCDKIVHFDFNDNSYVSDSCYNLVQGSPYNNASFLDDTLCLFEDKQYFSFNFFNNWFIDNPVAETFTLSFFFKSALDGQNAGLFSMNCEYESQGSVAEFFLEDGEIHTVLGTNTSDPCAFFPAKDVWVMVAITFDKGTYNYYVDGTLLDTFIRDPEPLNSYTHSTLGYVHGKSTFKGYFDDLCFWTSVLTAEEILALYVAGPSIPMSPVEE